MLDAYAITIAALAVLFVGLSKAGFGGGLGMLTTPMCVIAFGPKNAIGILLPLLCAGDAFSLYHYWGKWERRNLKYLLPGVVVGVIIGVQIIDWVTKYRPNSARDLNICIGVLAVSFVIFQLVKEKIFRAEGAFAPNHAVGIPCGVGAGITSTFAHGAGPLVSLFLIPQRMPKELYVGTTILVFTCINWIKMPFFFANHIITRETLTISAAYFPLIPVGVALGIWLNRKISERIFMKVVYAMTLLTGVQLIFNFNLAKLFH